MLKIHSLIESVNQLVTGIQQETARLAQQRINEQLEAEVGLWLCRERHQRRHTVTGKGQAVCQRCGTREVKRFSRNGHRRRQLLTTFGVLTIRQPRVVCECGGSVRMPFTVLAPRQRWWEDLTAKIHRWAEWGMSLRQMQTEIGDTLATPVGLRKLNSCVHQVTPPTSIELSSVPPIVMLDAIWVTLLTDTDQHQVDALGRQRSVKTRQKMCVLVALGLYPHQGTWGILGWHLADSESQPAWEALLVSLEQRGVYRQRGVELLIHDGGSGLIAALNLLYPHIPHQRCTFHKLRNLYTAIQAPPDVSRQEARQFKRDLLRQIQPIFDAQNVQAAEKIRDKLCEQWHSTQPKWVKTLQRDWHETVAFYRVLARFPNWPRTALRTTSLLERVNRMLRRLFRAAGAYHTSAGLLAAVTRVLKPKLLI